METITLKIDNQTVTTQKGKSVLEAALDAGIYIPHLCYHPDLPSVDNCKLCLVEIEGMEGFPTACTTPAVNGMLVKTQTEKVKSLRQRNIAEILSRHPSECGTCIKYLNCELQSLKQYFASDSLNIQYRPKLLPVNSSNPLFILDPNKCVLCGRCIRACKELRGVGVLDFRQKGDETLIGTAQGLPLADSGCKFCGACAEVCPTGAIMDKEELTRGKGRKAALIPCRYNCPAEIDVPGYIRLIREKNYAAAVALIREKVPFPEVLGYVCDHPCETICRRGEVNQAISVRDLKRFAVEHDNEKLWKKSLHKEPATNKKVAVIGSGPAGLTSAYYLARKGHTVTVFESSEMAGGMMRYGIPEYRLPRSVIEREIKEIENAGVEIKTKIYIDSIDKLFEQGFNAVLAAVGTQKGQKLSIPGADHKDVLNGVDFLRAVNQGERLNIGDKVLVLGGGNVAFDCARVARRLGSGTVQIACLEARGSLPATGDEIVQAEEEGILVHPSQTFIRILTGNGRITGVECLEVESFMFDEEKNLQIETREGSQHVLEADTVIFAIGQRPEVPECFGLETTNGSLIEMDPYTLNTSREGVYAAGDAVTGTSSVIKAIASGRKAAAAVDRFLEGDGNIEEKLAPRSAVSGHLGPGDGFAKLVRCDSSCVSATERLKGFCSVVASINEEKALDESKRCLQCDLRLKIIPVKFWGNY